MQKIDALADEQAQIKSKNCLKKAKFVRFAEYTKNAAKVLLPPRKIPKKLKTTHPNLGEVKNFATSQAQLGICDEIGWDDGR